MFGYPPDSFEPVFLKCFFGVPHLATYIFFLFVNEAGLGTLISLAWL